MKDLLNSNENVGLMLNSFSLPMKAIKLLFYKTTEHCQDQLDELIKVNFTYYTIIGILLALI